MAGLARVCGRGSYRGHSVWNTRSELDFSGRTGTTADSGVRKGGLVKTIPTHQDGYRINPTMNGGGRSVLIWGWTCRKLLVDKGKPLSGDKGIRTDEHVPKIWQGRMARVWMNVYAYKFGRSEFGRAVNGKWMILPKRRPRFACVLSAHSFC